MVIANILLQQHKRRPYAWTSPDGVLKKKKKKIRVRVRVRLIRFRLIRVRVRLIIFFAARDGEALYNQQKQDWELTVAKIMNSLLPSSDLN